MRYMLGLLATLALTAAPPATAGGGMTPAVEDLVRIEVLPGWRTDSGTHMAALRIALAPGWKTYWRAPGDGGIPPSILWGGSRNVASVAYHWPTPSVFTINGLRSIGYHDELVLPVEITPAAPGEPIEIRADIQIGICETVCIPVEANVVADISGSGAMDRRIAAALADRPLSDREAGVTAVRCDVEPIEDGLRLTSRVTMPALGAEEVAVFELADAGVWISESANRRDGGDLISSSELVPPSGKPFLLERSDVRITVLSGPRGVEMTGCPSG